MSKCEGLNDFLRSDQIATDPATLLEFGRDWTRYLEPHPLAVVFPDSTENVVRLVDYARTNRIALVPSGGRTGLSGGAVAANGEIVVSFAKMNRILEFDKDDQTVRVESGVVTEAIQEFAAERGLMYPVDFAATGSSQIGGNVATNAGGIKVLRYGLTRDWIRGLEVVTGTGDALSLGNGLVKNATGYDLRHLLIGSEGTLGLITHVTLKLAPAPKPLQVFLFALGEVQNVMRVFHAFRAAFTLSAFEMFTEVALDLVLRQHPDLKHPFADKHDFYVLVEFETDDADAPARALEIFEQGLGEDWMRDGVQAQSPNQARELWRLREDISESTAPFAPYKNDVSVRIGQVPEFLVDVENLLRTHYPHFTVVWFGHVGDGNLHINILRPEGMEAKDFVQHCVAVNKILFERIEAFGGSVSAEHGVGLTKKGYLHHSRSPAEISLMRGIKNVFDPDGIMNPGKIFDSETSKAEPSR